MIEGSDKQAVAGANTAIAYWKRSVTGSHSNAVFVGRVFDTFLGSAVASCDFRPKMPPPRALAAGEDAVGGDEQQEAGAALATFAAAERMLVPQGDEDRGDAELNFGEYSGLVLKAIGDGQRYTAIVRTVRPRVRGAGGRSAARRASTQRPECVACSQEPALCGCWLLRAGWVL